MKKELIRSFGGKLNGFATNFESKVESAHLKAYLKNKKSFKFQGKSYKVKELWQYLNSQKQ